MSYLTENGDLYINQGETLALPLTYYSDSAGTVAFNLTGYTARMQGRLKIESASTLFSLTTENGGITLGGSAGTIVLSMSATDTAALNFISGVYDLEIVSSGGVVTRLLNGSVFLSKEVTR